ncbi:hypothetical protein ACRAWF_38395 [Streptomyces sp. L7]
MPVVHSEWGRLDGDDGGLYLVMELVHGDTLSRLLKQNGPFSVHLAAAVAGTDGRAGRPLHRRVVCSSSQLLGVRLGAARSGPAKSLASRWRRWAVLYSEPAPLATGTAVFLLHRQTSGRLPTDFTSSSSSTGPRRRVPAYPAAHPRSPR